jgi:hypothetical protein
MDRARLPRVPRWCKSYADSEDARGPGPRGTKVNDTSEQDPQAPADPQPTDAASHDSEDEASVVWLVSYSDDDDRELRPPQIAEALRLGEINADTIVWRQGAVDWLPLAKVPELAKLLSASGETATAPLVAPNPALLRRAGAKPPEPNPGTVKAPSVRPMIAGRAVPMAKGTTKLGLPKFDPTKDRKADAPTAKAAVPDMTPTVPKSPAAPQTPTVPKAQAAPLTPTKSRVDTLQKADLFASGSDEDEAPISIEPEFMRPPSPAPARAMQRAKALSPGTLGMKKPAPPPRPPMKSTPDAEAPKREAPKQETPKQEPEPQAAPLRAKKAPPSPPRKAQPSAPAITVSSEPALTPDPGTPSLGTLAAPVRAETKTAEPKRTNDGLLNAEELLVRAIALDPAATGAESIEAASKALAEPVTPPAAPTRKDEERDAASSTPSKSDALAAPPLEARSADSTDAPVSQARPAAPAKPAGKNSWPVLAAVAAVALIAVLFARGNRDSAKEVGPETPNTATTQAAEPATAAPAEPAAPAPVATEAPAPAMTAASAPAETPPAQPQVDTPSVAAKEKPAAPTMAVAKTDNAAEPKEPKAAASQPEKPAKTETKPAETKPAAPEPKEVAVGGEFDKAAAGAALTGAAQEASGCRKEGDPSGVAVVHVTFSNAGRATRAVIEGPPFAGTQTGGCIAATLRKATVPPYGGDRVTVTKKVVIR